MLIEVTGVSKNWTSISTVTNPLSPFTDPFVVRFVYVPETGTEPAEKPTIDPKSLIDPAAIVAWAVGDIVDKIPSMIGYGVGAPICPPCKLTRTPLLCDAW